MSGDIKQHPVIALFGWYFVVAKSAPFDTLGSNPVVWQDCSDDDLAKIREWLLESEALRKSKPRKVKLPETLFGVLVPSRSGYERYMKADDVIAALKAAGVEVE